MTELRGGSSGAAHTGGKGIAREKQNKTKIKTKTKHPNPNLESLVLTAQEGGTTEELICRIYGTAVPSCIDSQISEKQNLPQNTLTKARVADHILISQLMPGCSLQENNSAQPEPVPGHLLLPTAKANLASSPQP